VPATGDSVVVPNGSSVTLNVDTNTLASIQVDTGGTITLSGTAGFDVYLGGNLVNNGTLNFASSSGTNTIYLAGANVTSTLSGSGTWLLDNLDLNGNSPKNCTGACKVELSGSPNLQFSSATLFSALSATYTFNALGNSTATLTFSRAGTQTIATANVKYPNLVLAGSNTKTPSSGTLNILGDMTVSSGTTYAGSTNNPAVNLAGDFSNSGTFTSGSGVFTFNGITSQALAGATTFTNMTVNNASGLTLTGGNITVSSVLALTNGDIVTGANRVILGTAATVATPSAASYVVGTVQKNYAAASTFVFPVGDANNYTPVTIQGTAGFTAGSLSINTTGTDHPQVTAPIPSTGIDALQSVNRYWTLVGSGLPATSVYNATFVFINATPVDLDSGVTAASFIVQRYDGTNWNPTTLGTAGASSTSITGVANVYGDFAIGEPLLSLNGSPGAFNTFETSTPAGSVLGRLYTKVVGSTFTVSIVAVSGNALNPAPSTAALTVALIDASPTSGTMTAATNCRTSWTTVIQTQTVPAAVAWAGGRVNVTITAPASAVRNARIRVTQGVLVGCSSDNFAIRPQAFTITSTTATQNNTSGGPIIKTGANFNLIASSAAGYDGTPGIVSGKVTGTPTAGTLGGTFPAAVVGTGAATGTAFFYSEVGNFGLLQDAVVDSGFTSVDQSTDCVVSNTSNILAGGKYGCSIGSNAVLQTLGSSGFGRFVPDNFAISLNAPTLGTVCESSPSTYAPFTYVGQSFGYTTLPSNAQPAITVTARNGTTNGLLNATTLNYAGAYMKFSNTSGTSLNQTPYLTQAARYTRFDTLGGGTTPALDVTSLPATTSDPAIGAFTAGVGTLTFSSGTGFVFTRSTTTPTLPFNADIALAINVIDGDGILYAGNPARFGTATASGGMAFAVGDEMRYGRMRMGNAFGSVLLDLPVPLSVEYYSAGAFATNTTDSCTTLAASNIRMSPVTGNPDLSTTCKTKLSPTGAINFNAGKAVAPPGLVTPLKLTKPGTGNNGAVDLSVDLTPPATGTTCIPASSAVTPAAKSWLLGNWGTTTYTADPAGRATFGIFKSADEFIYLREVY